MTAAFSVLLVILLVIVAVLVIAAIWGVGIYNGVVGLRNACKNAFARFGTFVVTAGASTPAFLIDEVCDRLEKAA